MQTSSPSNKLKGPIVSNFKTLIFKKNHFSNAKNVTIEFWFTMWISYELRFTIITLVRNLYPKRVLAMFKKYLKYISWVISGTNSSSMSCNPRHPSRNIRCNHRHHLLQPSCRRIFSTSINKKLGPTATSTVITKLLPLADYISGA